MFRRIFKGLCGIAAVMAGGGALIVVADKVQAGAPCNPEFMVPLFFLSAGGGFWLILEALLSREI
jgi:hypothetical protein